MDENEDPHLSNKVIKLNVGGHIYTTLLSTLTRDPNSMLASMFSGRYKVATQEDGSVFIDRDGTHFRYILNYLRGCNVQIPNDVREINELTDECEYFQIQGLISMMQESRKQKKKKDVIIIEQRIGRITGTCDLSFLNNLFTNDPLFDRTGINWANKNEIAMPFVLTTKQKAIIFATLFQHNFNLEGTRRLEMKGEGFDNAEYIFVR